VLKKCVCIGFGFPADRVSHEELDTDRRFQGVDATADCLDADSERLGRSRQPTSATKQPNGIGAIRTPWRCSDEYVAGFR